MSVDHHKYDHGFIARDSVTGEWTIAQGSAFPSFDDPKVYPPNQALLWRHDYEAWYMYDGPTASWLITLNTPSPVSVSTVVVSATSYAVLSTDFVLLVDASGGDVTIALPDANSVPGRHLIVKKIDNSANKVIIDAAGADLIDGEETAELLFEDEAVPVVSDGVSEWGVL